MQIEILSRFWFWYVLAAIGAVALSLFSYRNSFPPLSRFWKAFLVVTRSSTIILLAILLSEPLINLYSSKLVRPKLAVLVDASGSMRIKDDAATRIELADSLVQQALKRMDNEYSLFSFSSDLSSTERLPREADVSGDATSIANALAELGRRRDLPQFGAVILVTDGRQNLGDDPVETAMKLNIPIHTLTVGTSPKQSNLAIEKITHPLVAYSGSDFKVDVEISAAGLETRKSKILLKKKSTVVAERPFSIPRGGRKIKTSFVVKAPEPGEHQYTVSTPTLPGEQNKADNERLFAIRVLESKVKIFLGTSTLGWEFKFLKRILSGFEEFQVDAVYGQGGGRFSGSGPPKQLEGLKKYDVLVLIDSSPSDLHLSLADLEKFVEEGGALVYVAGIRSPTSLKTFENLLPVHLERPQLVQGEFSLTPSATLKQHAVILLDDDPDESAHSWQSLPPLGYLLTGLSPTGDVLLEATPSSQPPSSGLFAKGNQPQPRFPVLTVAIEGRGRTAAITGFPWWKSHFASVRDQAMAKAIPTFWRNLMRWASSGERLSRFRVMTDSKVYRLGRPVKFTAHLFDEIDRPKNGALVSAAITPKGEATPIKDVILAPVDDGVYAGLVSTLPPGDYLFRATALSYGDTLGTASGRFSIEQYSLEMASSSPDYNLTRRISEATGGIAYTQDNFHNFPEQLKLTPFREETRAQIRPFGMAVFLILVVAGLSIEWAIRKRLRLP